MKDVTPAEAGVQKSLETLDSRLRGNDEKAAVRRPKIPLPLPPLSPPARGGETSCGRASKGRFLTS